MKENKKKMNQELKKTLLGNLTGLLTLIVFGFLSGYLLWKTAMKNDDPEGPSYFIFAVILFSGIGIFIYLVKLLKKIKDLKKRNKTHE